MRVELLADERSWLVLPRMFPTQQGESQEQWEDRIVAGMRGAWNGALDPAAEEAVREALRHGISEVAEADAITLQYWPSASIVNAIVHVVVRDFEPGQSARIIPLDDAEFVVEPVSLLFDTENLGTGVESRYLSGIPSDPAITLGGVNFLFENDRGYVFVATDATLPRLIGLMLEPLHDIVRSIRVHDDERGAWGRSVVEPSAIPSRGESWDDAEPAVAAS